MTISPGGTYYDDEELDALFKAIGFVVIQWGQAEQSLDLVVAILYQSLGGKKLTKKLPKMLSPKIDFLKKCLSQIPELAPLKIQGETLSNSFTKLSTKRHDLIHGAIGSLSMQDNSFLFTKLDIKNDFHVLREFQFDSTEYPAFTKDLIDLGNMASSFGKQLLELSPE